MNENFPKPENFFEKRGSFEADFEMIQSSEEEEIFSSHDSGMEMEGMERSLPRSPFALLRSAEIKARRKSRTKLFADEISENETVADSESSPPQSPKRVAKRLSLFDSPHTPRSLVRRLSQGKENPRLRPRNMHSPVPEAISNPFTPTNRNFRPALSHSARQIRQSRIDVQSRYKSDFLEVSKIGSGDFGEVFKVQNRLDGCFYAIKKTKNPIIGSRTESKAIREVCAHAVLDKHDNVVRYYSAWSEGDRMFIQSEFCNGGSLGDEIADRRLSSHVARPLDQDSVFNLLRDTTSGLAYIHRQKLAHMDIKPANILRVISENKIEYKLGDLGHVTPYDETRYEEGDCRYAAKEIIQSDSCIDLRMGDIFSLGLSAFESATLKILPKNGSEWHHIRSPTFSQLFAVHSHHLSQELATVISRMLADSPSARPTAEEVHLELGRSEVEALKRQVLIERNTSKLLSSQLKRQAGKPRCLKRTKTS
ncbi:Oidioi.mRNA.OKI2018_I69.chr2.g4695.t1.cds [Oikopleura dioica]|uniref:Oidioi.mRNA.OKI2018_I69.chr2.g4695.t1.cds n=1 Tax=Oikopleura dioica TaxID=34765 RepID=A0ABN7SY87_OIKDI|nr:Oidioi.mRNA.OKI2018_I69.chr2.g4695.t1.cds [Oikopleura dioica]